MLRSGYILPLRALSEGETMRSVRGAVGAFGVSLGLLVVVPSTGTATADEQEPTQAEEFVVAFDPANLDAALAAVAAAGGTVARRHRVGRRGPGRVRRSRLPRRGAGGTGGEGRGSQPLGRHRPSRHAAPVRPTSARRSPRDRVPRDPPAPIIDPRPIGSRARPEPLADRQWDMAAIGATPTGAWQRATGRGVTVGIIDTGVDSPPPRHRAELQPLAEPQLHHGHPRDRRAV